VTSITSVDVGHAGKVPTLSVEQETSWAPGTFWTLWKREDLLILLGIEPRFLGSSVRNLVTVINNTVLIQTVSLVLKGFDDGV
jgi:hypothetical protein